MCFNLNCNIFILFRVIFFLIYCSYLDKEFQSIWRFHLREIFTLSPRWIIGSCGQVVSRSQFCHYSLKYAPDKHVVISTGWKAIFFSVHVKNWGSGSKGTSWILGGEEPMNTFFNMTIWNFILCNFILCNSKIWTAGRDIFDIYIFIC